MTVVRFSDRPELPKRDVCIIGAGPIGIALAFACEAQGLSILLLESGQLAPDAFSSGLSRATLENPSSHAAMELAVCRALGGTSHWWGGRCVPFDDIDFVPRSELTGAEWPFAHEEVARWYAASSRFLGCGSSEFSRSTVKADTGHAVAFDSIERWASKTNLAAVYGPRLERSDRICVVLGATITKLQFGGQRDRIRSITVADRSGIKSVDVGACVVACGGLETTRLLLVSQQEHPGAFGGAGGALGRYYMGHISGKLADIVFDDPADAADYDFHLDKGVFLRRHFALPEGTLEQEKLLNIAFWIDNPPFYTPEHGNGALSLVWLALTAPILGRRLLPEAIRQMHLGPRPYRFHAHAANVLGGPIETIGTLATILRDRYLRRPRKPGFVVRSKAGRYGLHYHAQQAADARSCVSLSDETDELGMRRLHIDLRFGKRDAESVVRAHELLDEGLRKAELGHLEYHVDPSQRLDLVMKQAADGFHQLGTTRMGTLPATSVVDANCRVYGTENLFVASTSVFPTSGQANPTLLGVALAFRLGEFLASGLQDGRGNGLQTSRTSSFSRDGADAD